MWEQQLHCQISLQLAAEELFNSLDERLSPKVFMVGINITESMEPLINLESRDCDYSIETFKSFLPIIAQSELYTDHTPNPEQGHSSLLSNVLLAELQRILRQHKRSAAVESFVSHPAFINGYLVFVVTELDKGVMNTYYSLTKDYANIMKGLKISRSFIESILKVYLNASTNALKAKSQSEFNILSKSRDELVINAAQDFMATVALAGHNHNYMHVLYEACNTISSLKYEGKEGLGKIIIADPKHHNVRLTMELEEPILLKDFRKVRKFLELADNNYLLVSDSVFIYGLGKLTGKYDANEESIFVIHFTKHFHWEVLHHDKIMMSVSYRMPGIYNEQINKQKFYSTFTRVFKTLNREKLHRLWTITMEATKQKHGTILAISTAAESESKRLCNQSFKIKPMVLNKEIVQQITSIDGAVLIDTNCNCFAIGVILDGIASSLGDSSRGARFNSAIRYYEHMEQNAATVLVVISEDGMINLVPDLQPQIRHSSIINKIKEFEFLNLAESKDRRRFNQLMEFFEKNSFYFNEDECTLINELKTAIEIKYRFTEGIKMIYDKFEINPKMNQSYYLKEA